MARVEWGANVENLLLEGCTDVRLVEERRDISARVREISVRLGCVWVFDLSWFWTDTTDLGLLRVQGRLHRIFGMRAKAKWRLS